MTKAEYAAWSKNPRVIMLVSQVPPITVCGFPCGRPQGLHFEGIVTISSTTRYPVGYYSLAWAADCFTERRFDTADNFTERRFDTAEQVQGCGPECNLVNALCEGLKHLRHEKENCAWELILKLNGR
jgi:hypothetical protein